MDCCLEIGTRLVVIVLGWYLGGLFILVVDVWFTL